MSKNIKLNYIYNLLCQILSLLTPLITAPYVSRVLGAEKIGIYSYTSSVAAFFILFATFGIHSHGQREVSYCQEDRKRRSEVFWNTEVLSIIFTSIVFVIYIIFCLFQKEYRMIFLYLSVSIVDVCLNIGWLLTGMEEFGKIVLRNIIIKVVGIIIVFTIIHSPKDLELYIAVNMLISVISNVSLWPFVRKYVDKINFKELRPFQDFKTVFSLFIPTIAVSIYTVLDKTMIGIITNNPSENGYYEQAMKLVKMVLVIVTSLGTVMIPRIGYLFDKNDKEQLREYIYKSFRFVLFLSIPMSLGLCVVSENLIPWFFGNEFNIVIPLLKILGFLIIAIGISNVIGMQYFVPTKRQYLMTRTVCIGAIVNFCFNLFLIPRFGCIGAACSSVIAEAIISIIQLWLIRKEISLIEIIQNSINYLLAGIIMMICVGFCSRYLSPSFIHTLLLIILGVFIYCLLLFVFKDSFFHGILKLLLKKRRKFI